MPGVSRKTSAISLPAVFGGDQVSVIEFEEGTIAFEDSGKSTSGKTFYCLPGIGDFRHTFRFLAPRLAASGHRVICQDLRGVGDSSTTFKSFTIEDCARDVAAVLDALEINTRIVLLGNSMSAAVSVSVATNHPDRVEAIVTTGGFFRDLPSSPYFNLLTPILFNGLWGQPVWVSFFRGLFGRPPADLDAYCAAVKAKMNADTKHSNVLGAMMRSSKNISWAKIADLKCRLLLINGSKDPDFTDPVAEVEFVAGHMRTESHNLAVVSTKIIEGAGHYPHNEAVDETYAAIIEFIA